jgi:sugar phosphate isomerase/epimerase
MKIGFLTACLRQTPLQEIIRWAGKAGFRALELSANPPRGGQARPNELDVLALGPKEAAALREACEAQGIEISCLTYCDNNLAADEARRREVHAHLRRVIDAAALLGVRVVSTFVGRDEHLPLAENVQLAATVLPPLLDYAGERGVRLAIENWPGVGLQCEGLIGNIFMSPVVWEELFSLLPHENFGLNFDPSHLYWQGIDYLQAARTFAKRIFHVHIKDTEILTGELQRGGSLLPRRWYRYRLPGYGAIQWPQFISTLREGGYDGALSIEHEDPVWSGEEERVREGLVLGLKYLSTYVA